MRRKTETEVRRFSSFELVARFTTNWEQQVDAPPSGAKVQNVAHPGRGWRGWLGWGGGRGVGGVALLTRVTPLTPGPMPP